MSFINYTDEQWSKYRNYADQVVVAVAPVDYRDVEQPDYLIRN